MVESFSWRSEPHLTVQGVNRGEGGGSLGLLEGATSRDWGVGREGSPTGCSQIQNLEVPLGIPGMVSRRPDGINLVGDRVGGEGNGETSLGEIEVFWGVHWGDTAGAGQEEKNGGG